MRRRIHFPAAAFFLCAALTAQAQPTTSAGEGGEFWLAFQKNFRDYVTDAQSGRQLPSEPLRLELAIISQQKTRGVVEISGIGFRKEFTVTPGEVTRVAIDNAAQLRTSRNVEQLGVHVTADALISVYGLNHRYQTTDTYAAIPVDLLGTSYRAVGYGWLEADLLSQVAVVATEDNTIVTITPTVAVQTTRPRPVPDTKGQTTQNSTPEPRRYQSTDANEESVSQSSEISVAMPRQEIGRESQLRAAPVERRQEENRTRRVGTPERSAIETITVTLNRGETYQIIPIFDPGTTSDLTGSIISSTKPVSVFSGHNCAYVPDLQVPGCNLLVEQLPPMTAWGRTFVAGTIAGRSSSVVRVIAMNDGTEVARDDVTSKVLNAGEFIDYKNATAATVITASQPALVVQFSPGFRNGDNVGDPMMLLVPPVEQFTTVYRFATPVEGSWHHYINIATSTSSIRDIRIDDLPLGSLKGDRITTVGNGALSVTQVEVTPGEHVVTSAEPFGAYQYGIGYDKDAYDAYGNGGGQEYRNLRDTGK